MTLKLSAEGGRYPYALAPYRPADIRATLEVRGSVVHIRIDDLRNPDRWEEFFLERAALERALQGSQSCAAGDGTNTAASDES